LAEATTDVRRERLAALIAAHDAKLADIEADRPPKMKRCRKCRKLMLLTTDNFVADPLNRYGWRASCLRCRGGSQPETSPDPKPQTQSQIRAELLAAAKSDRQSRMLEIVKLIEQYEAVRDVPGPDRAAAYALLGEALKQYGAIVSDGVREWAWSRGLGAVTSRLLVRTWVRSNDPIPVRSSGIDRGSYSRGPTPDLVKAR
jgi:hypothetical protein